MSENFDAKFGPPPLAHSDVAATLAAQVVALTLLGYASRVSFLCSAPGNRPSLLLSFVVACCVAAATVVVARSNA